MAEPSERNELNYTLHLCPPDYPTRLFPFTCRHEPEFGMLQRTEFRKGRIEIYHAICMACGRPKKSTYGGNALTDGAQCYEAMGFNAKIGQHLLYLRRRYMRIAVKLFNENGWNGRHRKWAELIDPHLTMRIVFEGAHPDGTQFYRVCMDETYFRPGDD